MRQNINGAPWTIARVWDYNGDQVADGNITVNTTKTIFHLIALAGDAPENGLSVIPANNSGKFLTSVPNGIDIAVMTSNGDGTYKVTQPSGLTQTLDGAGNLKITIQGTPYTNFGVVVENPVPGDDIGIQFLVSTSNGNFLTDTGSAPRLAVYDKKMLWRANLYMDEGGGGADWNDLHPWVNGNDWNRSFDGVTVGPPGSGNGGQVPILPFSSIRNQGKAPDVHDNVLQNSVAYDYPDSKTGTDDLSKSLDTPFDFNTKMLALKSGLHGHYDASGNPIAQGGNWNKTTAPESLWGNYLVAAGSSALPSVGLLYYDWIHGQTNLDPNLQSNTALANNLYFGSLNPDHIGTDCVGFTMNSMAYKNSPYAWATYGQRSYPADNANGSGVIGTQPALAAGDIGQLKQAVPGDVFYYGRSHVGVVFGSAGDGTPEGIQLIEAYFDGPVAYVNNNRTLAQLIVNNQPRPWVVVRLK